MNYFICSTCGTQFEKSETSPDRCPICEEERQYINPNGQEWTTLNRLKRMHKIVIQKKEPGLYGIGTAPEFGIGQRALFLQTPQGNLLWDCISLIDEAAVDIINSLGGLNAIAISHPHYYTSMVEWSRAFGNVPVFLHQDDREWVQRLHKNITFLDSASTKLLDGVTLLNLGGHFAGGSILHWEQGADNKGVLLTSDILQVVPDRKHVSFMYSYPNHIPLNKRSIQRMTDMLEPLKYERIYGAWWDQNIIENGKQAVRRSAERYVEAIS